MSGVVGAGCGPSATYSRSESGTGGAQSNRGLTPGSGGRTATVMSGSGGNHGTGGKTGTGGTTGTTGTGGTTGTNRDGGGIAPIDASSTVSTDASVDGSTADGSAPEVSNMDGRSGGADGSFDAGTNAGGGGQGAPVGPLTISVDFVSTAIIMDSSETAGVIRASHWNAAVGGTGSLPNLITNGGDHTAAAISWNGPGVWALGVSDDPGDNRMMKGYLDPGRGQVATIKVSGLPGAIAINGYDVYVYGNGDVSNDTRAYQYAIGGLTASIVDGPNDLFNGTYVRATGGTGNFVIFRGLRGSSFTLTSTPGAALRTPRSPVNGLQIVAR